MESFQSRGSLKTLSASRSKILYSNRERKLSSKLPSVYSDQRRWHQVLWLLLGVYGGGEGYEHLPRAPHPPEDVLHGGGVRDYQEVGQDEAQLCHEAQQHQIKISTKVTNEHLIWLIIIY